MFSEGLSDAQIAASLLCPCRDLARSIPKLKACYGSRVCALPQGPLTMLEVGDLRENNNCELLIFKIFKINLFLAFPSGEGGTK
jgi:hypothetical protein